MQSDVGTEPAIGRCSDENEPAVLMCSDDNVLSSQTVQSDVGMEPAIGRCSDENEPAVVMCSDENELSSQCGQSAVRTEPAIGMCSDENDPAVMMSSDESSIICASVLDDSSVKLLPVSEHEYCSSCNAVTKLTLMLIRTVTYENRCACNRMEYIWRFVIFLAKLI